MQCETTHACGNEGDNPVYNPHYPSDDMYNVCDYCVEAVLYNYERLW